MTAGDYSLYPHAYPQPSSPHHHLSSPTGLPGYYESVGSPFGVPSHVGYEVYGPQHQYAVQFQPYGSWSPGQTYGSRAAGYGFQPGQAGWHGDGFPWTGVR